MVGMGRKQKREKGENQGDCIYAVGNQYLWVLIGITIYQGQSLLG